MKENVKGYDTSKEDFGKQILLQRHETYESSIKLKMKIDLDNKLKVLSKEESTKLNESRMSSENIAKKGKETIMLESKY